MPFTYEEKYPIVLDVVRKYKNKWRLDILHWMDFDDVSSEIVFHVFKKWHLWDQSKPLEPWVSRVCHNQIRNKLRNLYTNYARPCIKCDHNLGENSCAITKNHEQCAECPMFAAWCKQKRNGYNIKMPLELENHACEVNSRISDEVDYPYVFEKIGAELKTRLAPEIFQAFQMLFFEHRPEKEVATFLGYKNKSEASISKQMQKLKQQLVIDVKIILEEIDLSHG